MKFVIHDKVVDKDQSEESKKCYHDITSKLIDGTRYRFCKHCGMKAHADESYTYMCGSEYCRCSQ